MSEPILKHVGALADRCLGPWIYLALTSRGEGEKLQGLRIVVDCNPRSKAIRLGRKHHRLISQDESGDHFESIIVEEWAYSPDERIFLQWEVPENEIISDGEVQVVERRFKKK